MRRLRIRLNAGFSGPHAGFLLAEADGLLAEAGIAVQWMPGNGAAAVVADMAEDVCDLAYGDLSALVMRLGHSTPGSGPQAVFVGFNRTPLTIAVPIAGTAQHPVDLGGRILTGHARDAALLAFPALARAVGLDARSVRIQPSEASLAEQVRQMILGDASDGVFGFANTIIAALEGAGLNLAGSLRFLDYAEWLPDLYGNALIASRHLVEREPEVLRALVDAIARGFAAAVADPDRGVEAVRRVAPGIDLRIETKRWRATIAREMGHPEAALLGIGDAHPARLAQGITLLAEALDLPRKPGVAEVFTPDFLPAIERRQRVGRGAPAQDVAAVRARPA
jgi:NitT/TauT family transport system substrate-binding protein